MGLDVYIVKPDDFIGGRWPDWNTRGPGGREFWTIFKDVPFVELEDEGYPRDSDWIWYRPADFIAFRNAAFPDDETRERWHEAADILEANLDYWLYFSW